MNDCNQNKSYFINRFYLLQIQQLKQQPFSHLKLKAMVKHYVQNVDREPINQESRMLEKLKQLEMLRRHDFIRDRKKACAKNKTEYKKQPITINQFLHHTSELKITKVSQQQKQIQDQVHAYKVGKANAQFVLEKINKMGIKNQRPPDYLVEMYKSDKQMIKVRRYLTEKEERVKQKLQGKDWMSKAKRRERAKKKAQSKKEKKKSKVQAKRPKPRMDKVNGKRKIKK